MLKGKNLLILLGVVAVGYYLWNKNQSKKVIVSKPMDEEQNADGQFTQGQLARLRRIAANNPQRAQKVAARMYQRNM